MAIRLPRLPTKEALVQAGNFFPSIRFQRWWQDVVKTIEGQEFNQDQIISDLATTQSELEAAQEEIAQKQDAAEELNALAGLDATLGLLEQTGAAAFTKRAIGVGTVNSIPRRSDADNRYVMQDQTSAWAFPTGTASRAAFASYAGQAISNPPTQAEVQAIDDHLVILSQRLNALVTDLRNIGALT